MGKKMIPVMITTMAALENALAEEFELLYLDAQLYDAQRERCDAMLKRFACRRVMEGQRGTFFQRKTAEGQADILQEDIFDPLCIL